MSDRAKKLLKILATHGVPASSKKDYETAIEIIETAFLVSDEQTRISAIKECAEIAEKETERAKERALSAIGLGPDIVKKHALTADVGSAIQSEILSLIEAEEGK